MPILLGALLAVAILEVVVTIKVGMLIGVAPTVASLIAGSALGGYLTRRAGRRVWRALTGTSTAGTVPAAELADAALVFTGGVLLLTPGFLTDLLGFAAASPLTRPLLRRAALALARRRRPAAAAEPATVSRVIRGQVIHPAEGP